MTPVAALRLALRAMLADGTYPEAQKERAVVEQALGGAGWSETQTSQLRTLALRWGTHQGQEVLETLRQTLDVMTEKVPGDAPSRRARREGTRAALDAFLRRTGMLAENDVEDKSVVIDEDTMDALVGDPAYKELMIQYEQMKSPPYNTPPKKLEDALAVVKDGKITQATCPSDMYEVVGSKGTCYYVSLDGCSCPNGQKGQRTKYGCYHAVAVELYKRWQRELQPALFPKPLTVEERMAQKPASVPVAPSPLSPMPEDGFRPEPPQEATGEALEAPRVPTAGGRLALPLRSISAIIADLSRPLPAGCVATKTQGGAAIAYLHWQTVARVLDTYAPGWQGTVERLDQVGTACAITYRLTIPCAEGAVSREATGQEEEAVKGYGDSTSNSEAMAFKRAAAKFGVGAWLYDKDDTAPALSEYLRKEKAAALQELSACVTAQGLAKEVVITWLQRTTGAQKNSEIPLWAIRALLSHLSTGAEREGA